MVFAQVSKELFPLKFPTIIHHKNLYYIYGIKSTVDEPTGLVKFIILYDVYTPDFQFVERRHIHHKFPSSALIWNITWQDPFYRFLIEYKSVDKHNHQNQNYYYYIRKEDLEDFKVDSIVPVGPENHLIFDTNHQIIKTSKITIDEQDPLYYWGKYLFSFYQGKDEYQPIFDSVVDYKQDKGHLLHYIHPIGQENLVFFSIRCKSSDHFYYKLCVSKTRDWKNFYDTCELDIQNNLNNTQWYCYPEFIEHDEGLHILLNQDDFGKEKNLLLAKVFDYK